MLAIVVATLANLSAGETGKTLYQQADDAFWAGDFPLARKLSEAQIKQAPGSGESYILRGRILLSSLGQEPGTDSLKAVQALAHYTTAIELEPKRASAYAYRSGDYGNLGRCVEGIKDADRALLLPHTKREEATALYNRGHNHLGCKHLRLALKDFEAAARIEPSYGRPYHGMAKVFLELSMPKEALKAADDAIAGLHFPTTIFSYRAKAFILLNRLDEAEEAAEEGIRQMRSIGTSYEVRAEVSFKRGLHEEAIVYARKALECTPLLPRAHHLIALSLDGLGRSREGTAVLIAAPNEELQELGWDRKDEEFRTFSLTRCPNHSDQLPNLMGPASAMPDFSCGAEALQAAPAAPVQEPSVRPTPPQSVQRVIDRIQGKAPAPVRRR